MVEPVSGNVFADLGFPHSDARHLRAQLALRLNDLLKAEGLTIDFQMKSKLYSQ